MSSPTQAALTIPQAFTVQHKGRVRVLSSEVELFPPFLPGQPMPVGKKYHAIYDTGATNSTVSPNVVKDLALATVAAVEVGTAGGKVTTTSHLVNIGLPNKVMFPMVQVTNAPLQQPFDVLIGMDVLGTGDFAVTHHNGNTTFTFRCPSQREIDFVAEVNAKPTPAHSDKVSRNSLCTCGSGKKYKRCCGS